MISVSRYKSMIILQGDWTVKVYVDGHLRSFLNGVPVLPEDAIFQIKAWNHAEFIPPLNRTDLFDPPSASVYIKNVT